MLKIDPIELANSFQRSGGTDWVDFMTNVLWAACWQAGVPESAVVTCLRTDIPDGGVDTQVSLGSGRDVTGYLKDPTVWQFKAAREANVRPGELVAEVNKPYARERILAGDAYRLCLCAQLPPDSRAELETALEAAVAAINPSAPQPKVVTVDIVARIAGHFPNLLQEFHGQFLQSKTLRMSSRMGLRRSCAATSILPSGSSTDDGAVPPFYTPLYEPQIFICSSYNRPP